MTQTRKDDAPERIMIRVDYDGTHDGQWIACAPYEPPHPYTGMEPQYVRADLALSTRKRLEAADRVAEKLTECRDGATLADMMEWADEMTAVINAYHAAWKRGEG